MENNFKYKLTFCEYFRYTKFTTANGLKFCGIISTLICVFIAYKEFIHSDSIITSLKWFIICTALGNAFGLFICLLGLTSSFINMKSTISLFNSIPKELKEKFTMFVIQAIVNPKYEYMRVRILSTKPDTPLLNLEHLDRGIGITVVANVGDKNFQKCKLYIDKKYKKGQISLTGWGLSKVIGHKTWKKLSHSDIETHINELIMICEEEKLEIIVNR